MTTPSTVLPTEEGLYLFSGLREGPRSARDLNQLGRPEVVRITRDASGNIVYVGADFFYHPEKAIGAWIPIAEEAAALLSASREVVLDHLARTEVPRTFEHSWGGHSSRESIVGNLARFGTQDTVGNAELVFERAVRNHIVEPDTTPGYDGWWRLTTAGAPG